jgi:Uma2 family endonuclease
VLSEEDMKNVSLKIDDSYTKEQAFDDIPVSEDGRFVTEEEYWMKYYEHPDFRYEWNNGILEEAGVSDYLNVIMYQWLTKLLGYYLETFKVGKMVNIEFGFCLALADKTSIRIPDLAVIVNENPTDLLDEDHSYKGTFDLCVELISDLSKKDIERDAVVKKKEYEDIGVREYYILDALDRYMAFYRRNKKDIFEPIKPIKGDIICSDVLKGFQFRVSDLFRQPLQEELVDDELYKDFVFPAYNEIKMRAEQAEKKAEFLEAKLRFLGISID